MDAFRNRHLGVTPEVAQAMAAEVGYSSVQELSLAAVPESIRRQERFSLPGARSERDALAWLRQIMGRNKVCRSYIGQGYHDCITPAVIQS